ncbi:zinc ribbon domain-containing protein [Paenibacillus sp. 1A_MP2]|uniref:zinc ribbon domain-containing protein n=1 Tax=Paenibacillus sp. 1A_MP2 TaxID=3457495 RepID=UPI003FCE429C
MYQMQGTDCNIKEVSMSGAGLSKMFDIQHNHYLFVACSSCGYVEVFDPDVLKGKNRVRWVPFLIFYLAGKCA